MIRRFTSLVTVPVVFDSTKMRRLKLFATPFLKSKRVFITIMAVMTVVVVITMVWMTMVILVMIITNKSDNGGNDDDDIDYDVMIEYGDV